ncbi:TPM domain-containing protein [Carboxydothermus hydrogenoformans]|uniref:TPM domain-containing protein n=1 Tax=Carboxydothermus hydrogenoformans (strain ATCC BAA-161 / DSM 6008 / Z-2901) TaxID=246194 RepID=Q3A9C2_CARHZ|nr:TPM domain-containing protein [Carboxydothermus hydrogenoformans]ABB14106.1 conserved hypothetical protein [Carboxydothermus hydrogenoformans Z-2901]
MKIYKYLIGVVILLFLISSSALAIVPKPQQDIYVADYAGVLSPATREEILRVNRVLYAKTGAQIAVVTVNSLEGMRIEEYALEVLRQWGVGSSEKNNGVVVLVAIKDRKARIEVGYGLEGAIPDGKAGRILREEMIPYFSNGDYDRGILLGFRRIAAEVAREYGVNPDQLSKENPALYRVKSGVSVEVIGAVFVILIILFFFITALLRPRKYGYYDSYRGPDFDPPIFIPPTGPFGGGDDDFDDNFGGGSGGGGGASGGW